MISLISWKRLKQTSFQLENFKTQASTAKRLSFISNVNVLFTTIINNDSNFRPPPSKKGKWSFGKHEQCGTNNAFPIFAKDRWFRHANKNCRFCLPLPLPSYIYLLEQSKIHEIFRINFCQCSGTGYPVVASAADWCSAVDEHDDDKRW